MYYQPEAMLEQYDIEIKQITKGRGVFCCETDQGKKVLAPFRGSAERAKFVREILCSMQEKGYPVEQVSLTKDGQCVVTDESGMRFWLKDLVEGNECQTGRAARSVCCAERAKHPNDGSRHGHAGTKALYEMGIYGRRSSDRPSCNGRASD